MKDFVLNMVSGGIFKLRGQLENSESEKIRREEAGEEYIGAKYEDVELTVIGGRRQVEGLVDRLNAAYDGGVAAYPMEVGAEEFDGYSGSCKPDSDKKPAFEYGDRVSWRDGGNQREGVFAYVYCDRYGVVYVAPGMTETVLLENLTLGFPEPEPPAPPEPDPEPAPEPERKTLMDWAGQGEPIEDKPACNFVEGDRVEWHDPDGNLLEGEYRKLWAGRVNYGVIKIREGYYQHVPIVDLRPAERPDLVRGDRVTWTKEDGLQREGEFRYETPQGTALVVLSRSVSSYVPMHKLRKLDPSTS